MAEVKNTEVTPSAEPKRSLEDIIILLRRQPVSDWLYVQRTLDMDRTEIQKDEGVLSVVAAYFIEKKAGPGADLNKWLHADGDDLEAFLNLEQEDENEAPKS